MIGLDTNVLVRYIMQDDARQSAKATALIDGFSPQAPGFVPLVAVIELVWVLSSCYELGRDELAQMLDTLLRSKELLVDRADQVMQALRAFRAGRADFADCLLAAGALGAGCERVMTFDVAASKAAGMTLLT